MNYAKTSEKILALVGEKENVVNVVHCATRLRFTLKDESKANVKELENMPEILSVVKAGGQFQVVIGTEVAKYHECIMDLIGNNSVEQVEKQSIGSAIVSYLSGTMAPLIPALIGCSVLRGFLVIFVNLGLMQETTSTYSILYAATNSVYYFLPVLAGFSAANKLKVNPYVAACIMGSLLVPQFTGLYVETGNIVSFFGIPLMMFDYSSSLFPALFGIGVYSIAEKWLDKHLPKDFKVIVIPLIGIAVFVPLTALAFGPIAYYVAQIIATVFNAVYSFSPLVSGVFVGGLFAFLVVIGVHWAVVPVVLTELSMYGFSRLFGIWWFANVSQYTLPFGVMISTKDKSERNVSISYLFSCLVSGITEPVMFGYVLRNKKFVLPIIISGGITGGLAAVFGAKALTFTIPSLLALGTVTTEAGGLPLFILLLVVEMIIGALITKFYVFGKKDRLNLDGTVEESKVTISETENEVLIAPITGTVKPLSECPDNVFSSETLGKGCVIEPSEGKVYAPCNGEISDVFDTKHVISMVSENGAELMIHVGMDTVSLNGEGFDVKVKAGDRVKAGDLLMEFNMDFIKSKGLPVITPVIVLNYSQYKNMDVKFGVVKHGDTVITL